MADPYLLPHLPQPQSPTAVRWVREIASSATPRWRHKKDPSPTGWSGEDVGCYHQAMTKPKKKPALVVKASVWLRDEQIFTVLKDLDHTPRPGEEFVIDGELWQIVEWMDRIECERVANEADPDHWTTITSSFQVRPNRH